MRLFACMFCLLCCQVALADLTITEVSNTEETQSKSLIKDGNGNPVNYNDDPENPLIVAGTAGSFGDYDWESSTSEIDENGDWAKCYSAATTGYTVHTDIDKVQISASLVIDFWMATDTANYLSEVQAFNWCSREVYLGPPVSATYEAEFRFSESGLNAWGDQKNGVFLRAELNEHWCQWTFDESLGISGKWVQTGSNSTWNGEYDGWEGFETNSVYFNEYILGSNPAEAKVEINSLNQYLEASSSGTSVVVSNELGVSIYVENNP